MIQQRDEILAGGFWIHSARRQHRLGVSLAIPHDHTQVLKKGLNLKVPLSLSRAYTMTKEDWRSPTVYSVESCAGGFHERHFDYLSSSGPCCLNQRTTS